MQAGFPLSLSLGATIQHAVRIKVPAAMPGGQVLDLIEMTVTAN